MASGIVKRIVDEGDRVILYLEDDHHVDYHVIASRKDIVSVGDVIVYQPYGVNFGWFESKRESVWPCGHTKLHPEDELCRACSP